MLLKNHKAQHARSLLLHGADTGDCQACKIKNNHSIHSIQMIPLVFS